jgi:hypothetical protein
MTRHANISCPQQTIKAAFVGGLHIMIMDATKDLKDLIMYIFGNRRFAVRHRADFFRALLICSHCAMVQTTLIWRDAESIPPSLN